MEKIKHTELPELPWKTGVFNGRALIEDRDGLAFISSSSFGDNRSDKIYEFIVQACNHHYLLVEALKEALHKIEAGLRYAASVSKLSAIETAKFIHNDPQVTKIKSLLSSLEQK